MTKELIEEARERATIGADVDPIDAARLLNELADALEATTRAPVQGEPNGGHAQQKCPHCEGGLGTHTMPSLDGAPCMICASCNQVSLAVDWLEGEPNDDREAILRKALKQIREIGEAGLAGPYVHDLPRDADPNWGWLQTMWPIVVAVDCALAERVAVPDAATEAKANVKIADLVYENASLKAERDAATEAIERVRAIHKVKHGEKARYAPGDEPGVAMPTHFEPYSMCEGCSATWPCQTIAALDGAPEPEWEWGYAGETLVGVHNSISRESAEEDVANLRRYWKDERKFWVVRRTPASEWLPVEGESKP